MDITVKRPMVRLEWTNKVDEGGIYYDNCFFGTTKNLLLDKLFGFYRQFKEMISK